MKHFNYNKSQAIMIKSKEIAKVLSQLSDHSKAEFIFDGNDIIIRALDDASKLSLSTVVYYGNSYIPKSVRQSVQKQLPDFNSLIPTFLSVDEQHFRIFLNYLGKFDNINSSKLQNLLEEFGSVADEWRLYLDDQDRNDHIYIYKNR